MLKQLVTFLDAIRCSCLLKPAQIEQITSWITDDSPDPQAIAREIVQRGWLTAFQVKLFWKNRGGELFLGQFATLRGTTDPLQDRVRIEIVGFPVHPRP